MTIEVGIILSVAAVVISLIFNVSTWKRATKQDTKSDATQLTTVIVKLENIQSGITEIKSDVKNVKTEVQELRERTVKNESAISSAHQRIDSIEKR